MDHQFDVLTRVFATCTTRRQALALLAAMTVAGNRPGRAAAVQGDASTCEAGLTDCGGACVDLQSDLNNCGACGEVCQSGLVPVECRSGVCERANCPVGVEYCGAVDGCRDLSSDPEHCGGCQQPCASGVCSGGVCAEVVLPARRVRPIAAASASIRAATIPIAERAATCVLPAKPASRASVGVPAGFAAPKAR